MSKEYALRSVACEHCNREHWGRFSPSKPRRFCSRACFRSADRPKNKTGQVKKCSVCGAEVYICKSRLKSGRAYFCNPIHANEYQARNKKRFNCLTCGQKFNVPPSYINNPTKANKYCSAKCYQENPATKEKLLNNNLAMQQGKQTQLEMRGYSLLEEMQIPYAAQVLLFKKFCVDAFVDKGRGLVIQFDGDYWHGNPLKYNTLDARQEKRRKLDASQDKYLRKCGLSVVRVWEQEIYHNLEVVKTRLLKAFEGLE